MILIKEAKILLNFMSNQIFKKKTRDKKFGKEIGRKGKKKRKEILKTSN